MKPRGVFAAGLRLEAELCPSGVVPGHLRARWMGGTVRAKDARAVLGFGTRPNRRAVVRAGKRLCKRFHAHRQRQALRQALAHLDAYEGFEPC